MKPHENRDNKPVRNYIQLDELLKDMTDQLRHADDQPRRLAVILLARHMNVSEQKLRIMPCNHEISSDIADAALSDTRRAASGEPVAYIQGEAWFFGRLFHVGPGVLIPRPDTEVLLEAAVDEAGRRTHGPQSSEVLRILELCTGSGVLAISLMLELREAGSDIRCQSLATDLSDRALSAAAVNRSRYGLDDRLELIRTDLFPPASWRPDDGLFDMLLANPPYISRAEYQGLDRSVRSYEPEMALVGGEDGLDFYRRIAIEAPRWLRPGALLLLEHGWEQGEACTAIFRGSGLYEEIKTLQDYGGRDRVLSCRLLANLPHNRSQELEDGI